MEHFKRAFTLRKRKTSTKTLLDSNSKPTQWNDDEKKVRESCCSFQVKYLGSIEVFESRGMPVCEEAMKQLLKYKSKKKSKRAILYVNGDALRVTEEISKGLIVDQVIEKVSFCAPDRNHKRGFAYICRDATTRRWLCHGFKAVKESGERLSHAVGCAFAVCLEKKQQREKESVDVTFNDNKTSFTRLGSFRPASISERRLDPQSVIIAEPINNSSNANSTNKSITIQSSSIPRPHASQSVLEKQNSMRIFPKLQEQNNPFKRDNSVKITDLSANTERRNIWNNTSTITEECMENKDQSMSTNSINLSPSIDSSSSQHNNYNDNNNNSIAPKELQENNFSNLFSDDPFSAAPIDPAIHIKQGFIKKTSVTSGFDRNMLQQSMQVKNSTKLFNNNFQPKNSNYFVADSTNDINWNNQYKSFNGKLSTTWSDDILKPAVKEMESNEQNVQLCANSNQRNPFDVTWVQNFPSVVTNFHHNHTISINSSTNPFKS